MAQAYGLDSDLVYQRQWRKSTVNVASIQDYLVGLCFLTCFLISVIVTEIKFSIMFQFMQHKLVAVWRAVLQIPFPVMWKSVILLF